MKASKMNKMFFSVVAVLLMAGLSAGPASAKSKRHGMHHSMKMPSGMTTGRSSMTGGNAALSGNNGNSGSGSNSVGNVKGGNAGGMR
jgi:hypothetical protein